MKRSLHAVTAAALALVAVASAQAADQKWGKELAGQVLWAAGKVPANEELVIDKDKMHCLEKGKLYRNDLLVDDKTKGVANVLVWLVDADPTKAQSPLPTHKNYDKWLKKPVVIDQPCCAFTPRIVPIVAKKQKLLVKNSSPIGHNISVNGGELGPTFNQLIPPGKQYEYDDGFKPRYYPIQYSCSIHGWMKGYIIVVPSPYAAVTGPDGKFTFKDVPVGKYRLKAWHERAGWVLQDLDKAVDGKKLPCRSIPITIKEGVTKVPEIKITKLP
jgi:hypothetical protein